MVGRDCNRVLFLVEFLMLGFQVQSLFFHVMHHWIMVPLMEQERLCLQQLRRARAISLLMLVAVPESPTSTSTNPGPLTLRSSHSKAVKMQILMP